MKPMSERWLWFWLGVLLISLVWVWYPALKCGAWRNKRYSLADIPTLALCAAGSPDCPCAGVR